MAADQAPADDGSARNAEGPREFHSTPSITRKTFTTQIESLNCRLRHYLQGPSNALLQQIKNDAEALNCSSINQTTPKLQRPQNNWQNSDPKRKPIPMRLIHSIEVDHQTTL